MRIYHEATKTALDLGCLRDGGVRLTAEDAYAGVVLTVELVLQPEEVAQLAEYLRKSLERAGHLKR